VRIARRLGAQAQGVWPYANPTEIEAIGIPANLDRQGRLASPFAVAFAGQHQESEVIARHVQRAIALQLTHETCGACAMVRIVAIIMAL
jgi:hypothetical protein